MTESARVKRDMTALSLNLGYLVRR